MTDLIKRTYRITKKQDKKVKKLAKKLTTKEKEMSESQIIRNLIERV